MRSAAWQSGCSESCWRVACALINYEGALGYPTRVRITLPLPLPLVRHWIHTVATHQWNLELAVVAHWQLAAANPIEDSSWRTPRQQLCFLRCQIEPLGCICKCRCNSACKTASLSGTQAVCPGPLCYDVLCSTHTAPLSALRRVSLRLDLYLGA
jgi:hypothetical protein